MTQSPRDDEDIGWLKERLRATKERVLIEKLKPRFWFARLTLALNVLVCFVAVSWFEDASLTAQSIDETGRHGWLLILGTAFCCLVALADNMVNDLLPARFILPCALRWRHLGFIGIALQLGALGLLVAYAKGFTVLVLAYWVNAVLAAVLTFVDAFARYPRSSRWPTS